MGNSSCAHNSNAIPTAKPMFLGSSNSTVIPKILSDLTESHNSSYYGANLEFRLPLWSSNVESGATEFPDLDNMYYDLKSHF